MAQSTRPFPLRIPYCSFKYFIILLISSSTCAGEPHHLPVDYYAASCPSVAELVRREVECAVRVDPRNAALLLRLHFHDCFVQGCDGSVLLDDTVTLRGEKEAPPNQNSLLGFDLVDKIKNTVESECPGIVSCADILALCARDAVLLVGGPYWEVPVGRKDSTRADYELVDPSIPLAEDRLISLISKFHSQGLSLTDMVALSGAHTIGMARCDSFQTRIYSDLEATLPTTRVAHLRSTCPPIGGGNNTAAMDYATPDLFDASYYQLLIRGEGLLTSDQELYSSFLGFETRELVKKYAADPLAFFHQFSLSMVNLGNLINPRSFAEGEVRRNCRFVNT